MKSDGNRRLRIYEYKECNQLLVKNKNLCEQQREITFQMLLDAVLRYTAEEPALALQEQQVENSDWTHLIHNYPPKSLNL